MSTVTVPIFAVFTAADVLAEWAGVGVADGLLEAAVLVDELPHAAARNATAAKPTGAHIR
ncbi:MAG TPA: hypothetical protein VLW50_15440 [Streptosporangiaceae bacterium]|nr:hypothetical protein [Streptosporangiaceae bacterium]